MNAGGRLVPLSGADWADDAPGIRARAVEGVDGRRFAIVEYGPGAAREDWCLDGHYGIVLEGEIEYHFEDGSPPLRIAAGDALWLVGGGPAHQGTTSRGRDHALPDRPGLGDGALAGPRPHPAATLVVECQLAFAEAGCRGAELPCNIRLNVRSSRSGSPPEGSVYGSVVGDVWVPPLASGDRCWPGDWADRVSVRLVRGV